MPKRKVAGVSPDAKNVYADKKRKPADARPELPKITKITKITKHMPLDKFLIIMNEKANHKVFLNQVLQKTEGGNRGTCYALLQILEATYGKFMNNCNSDLTCLRHLLESKALTKANHVRVFTQLDILLEKGLFPEESYRSEYTTRQNLRAAIKTHDWGTLGLFNDTAKIMELTEKRYQMLISNQQQGVSAAVQNPDTVDEYVLLQKIKVLLRDYKNPVGDSWVQPAIAILQAATGRRWIEALVLTKFSLSEQSKFPPDLYVVVNGIGKDQKTAINMWKAAKKVANSDEKAELDSMSAEEVQATYGKTRRIPVPVLYRELGVTPQFILEISERLHDHVMNEVENAFDLSPAELKEPESTLTDVNVQKHLRSTYFKKSTAYFAEVWNSVKFKNVTHTWRKLYAYYSWLIFAPHENINAWVMKVLGHSSLIASFNYLTIAVIPHVNANPKIHGVLLSKQAARIAKLEADVRFLLELVGGGGAGDGEQAPVIKKIAFMAKEGDQLVHIDVFTKSQKKELHKKFNASEHAEKMAFQEEMSTRIADMLNEAGVSSQETKANLIRIGVPKSWAGKVLEKLT